MGRPAARGLLLKKIVKRGGTVFSLPLFMTPFIIVFLIAATSAKVKVGGDKSNNVFFGGLSTLKGKGK